jgi:hypothetical protein
MVKIIFLFLGLLFIFAGDSLASQLIRQKELAYALTFQEAELLSQRQRPWEKERAKTETKRSPEEKKDILELSGYYKNLISSSKTSDSRERFYSDLQRLRLETKLTLSDKIKFNAAFDQEAILGDLSHTSSFSAVRNKDQKDLALIDADRAYADKDHIYAKYSLYRAYFKYYDPALQFSFGKQLVDWGRCRFFSPMDLFNPPSPLDLEKDERLGADALDLEFPLSSFSNLNLVYAPRLSRDDSSFGSKLYYRMGNYDLFLIAGEFRKDTVIGGCFDGYIGNGGLRGEFTYTQADNGREYLRAVTGLEYNFPNKVYLLGEYFYNGGADDNNIPEFGSSYNLSSRVLSLKKNLFGLWLGYQVTPLLRWDNYTIYDADGSSAFFNPEIKYNLWADFDLSAGAQLFWGQYDSEFGSYERLYYAQAKYFF